MLHRFSDFNGDASNPQGDLTFDQSGNIYGTAFWGGIYGQGAVYELMPGTGGGWAEKVIFSVQDQGQVPGGGVVFDHGGNLYGVLNDGGSYTLGLLFELSLFQNNWTMTALHDFAGTDGGNPTGGLIMASSNLYGTTNDGGSNGGGTVFELTPGLNGWRFQTIFDLAGPGGSPPGPMDKLAIDAAGNLYGTAYMNGLYNHGSIFRLSPTDRGWTYTALHDFTGGNDGALPISTIVFDANGNMYGTTSQGGEYGYGVVWEITH